MALPALIQAAIARIRAANNDQWDATKNPSGLGQGGHRQNLVKDFNAVADVGEFTAENAESTAADVVKTAADRAQTGKDVVSSGEARDKAKAWANAAEDVEVEPGLFSGFHFLRKVIAQVALAKGQADRSTTQADRALSYAAGLKMPALTADKAGQYVAANDDGSAYVLRKISAATAEQIGAADGDGFADAKTLGPILNDMKAKAADSAAALVPIGGYLAMPFMSPEPGAKFVRALGQKISLAAYPKASVLPVVNSGDLYSNPWNGSGDSYITAINMNGNDSGSQSGFSTSDLVANRLVIIQNNYLRYYEMAGVVRTVVREAQASPSPQYKRACVLRDTDVVYINIGGVPSHLSIKASDFATRSNASYWDGSGASLSDDQTKLIELPNGTILAFWQANGSHAIARLRKTEGPAAWSAFNPPIGLFKADYRAWKDKAGRLYIAGRATTSTGDYSVFRTSDGESWTALGTIPNSAAYDLSVNHSWQRRDSMRPAAPAYCESPNGQQIIVRTRSYAHIFSKDGGSTWKMLTNAMVFPGLPTDMPAGQGSNTEQLAFFVFEWDARRSRWLFGQCWRRNNRLWYAIYQSSDLVSFSALLPATMISNSSIGVNSSILTIVMIVLADEVRIGGVHTGSAGEQGYYSQRYVLSTGVLGSIPDQFSNYPPYVAIDNGYSGSCLLTTSNNAPQTAFDISYQSGNQWGVGWVPGDGIDSVFPPTGLAGPVENLFYGDAYIVGGPNYSYTISLRYTYNPATERLIPRMVHSYYALGEQGRTQFYELHAGTNNAHGLRWYVRVD